MRIVLYCQAIAASRLDIHSILEQAFCYFIMHVSNVGRHLSFGSPLLLLVLIGDKDVVEMPTRSHLISARSPYVLIIPCLSFAPPDELFCKLSHAAGLDTPRTFNCCGQ